MITRVLGIALATSLSANVLLSWGYGEAMKAIGERDSEVAAAKAETKTWKDALKLAASDSDRAWGDLEAACKTNAAAAMKAGRTIERIVYAPRDPAAPRGLVGAGELRDVVGRPAPAPVPAGREGGEPRP